MTMTHAEHADQTRAYTGQSGSSTHTSQTCITAAASIGARWLHLASHSKLTDPRVSTSTSGPFGFAVSRPSIWNSLPPTLCALLTTLDSYRADER